MDIFVHVDIHIYTHTYIHISVHSYIYIYIYTQIRRIERWSGWPLSNLGYQFPVIISNFPISIFFSLCLFYLSSKFEQQFVQSTILWRFRVVLFPFLDCPSSSPLPFDCPSQIIASPPWVPLPLPLSPPFCTDTDISFSRSLPHILSHTLSRTHSGTQWWAQESCAQHSRFAVVYIYLYTHVHTYSHKPTQIRFKMLCNIFRYLHVSTCKTFTHAFIHVPICIDMRIEPHAQTRTYLCIYHHI